MLNSGTRVASSSLKKHYGFELQVTKWIQTNQRIRKSGKKKRKQDEVVFQKVRAPDVRLCDGTKGSTSKRRSYDALLNSVETFFSFFD